MRFSAISIVPGLIAAALLTGCSCVKHVPPGQSLSAATAKRPTLVALPAPPPQAIPVAYAPPPANSNLAQGPMPETEQVADAYTLGNLCLQQGRYPEAIAAYEAALKGDPDFAEAWNNLAIAYQDLGQDDKAMEAFRKYKTVAMH